MSPTGAARDDAARRRSQDPAHARPGRAGSSSWLTRLLRHEGLNFRRDVAPWLGDRVGIAMNSVDGATAAGRAGRPACSSGAVRDDAAARRAAARLGRGNAERRSDRVSTTASTPGSGIAVAVLAATGADRPRRRRARRRSRRRRATPRGDRQAPAGARRRRRVRAALGFLYADVRPFAQALLAPRRRRPGRSRGAPARRCRRVARDGRRARSTSRRRRPHRRRRPRRRGRRAAHRSRRGRALAALPERLGVRRRAGRRRRRAGSAARPAVVRRPRHRRRRRRSWPAPRGRPGSTSAATCCPGWATPGIFAGRRRRCARGARQGRRADARRRRQARAAGAHAGRRVDAPAARARRRRGLRVGAAGQRRARLVAAAGDRFVVAQGRSRPDRCDRPAAAGSATAPTSGGGEPARAPTSGRRCSPTCPRSSDCSAAMRRRWPRPRGPGRTPDARGVRRRSSAAAGRDGDVTRMRVVATLPG